MGTALTLRSIPERKCHMAPTLAQYQAISTDSAALAAAQATVATAMVTLTNDDQTFVSGLDGPVAFPSATTGLIDVITPIADPPGFSVLTVPLITN